MSFTESAQSCWVWTSSWIRRNTYWIVITPKEVNNHYKREGSLWQDRRKRGLALHGQTTTSERRQKLDLVFDVKSSLKSTMTQIILGSLSLSVGAALRFMNTEITMIPTKFPKGELSSIFRMIKLESYPSFYKKDEWKTAMVEHCRTSDGEDNAVSCAENGKIDAWHFPIKKVWSVNTQFPTLQFIHDNWRDV